MDAGTLDCPKCGAAVSKDSTQCQYCHALLETAACPKCMGMMFVGTKFCPHCGAAAQELAAGQAAAHSCPRCHMKLQRIEVAKNPLEECMHCGGLWVDVASFDRIVSNAEAQTAATGLKLPPPPELNDNVRYVPCPQCGNMMNRLNYAGRSGVVIEVCRAHGIWLDRDQIRQIISFIQAGGMDRARKLQIEELHRGEAARADQSALSDAEILGSFGHPSVSSSPVGHDLVTGIFDILTTLYQ